jgi:hypothetical protein
MEFSIHKIDDFIYVGGIYNEFLLAYLAKGNVSFCHHLVSVVR